MFLFNVIFVCLFEFELCYEFFVWFVCWVNRIIVFLFIL